MKVLFAIIFSCSICSISFGQLGSVFNRTSIGGKYAVTKKWSIAAEGQVRWNLTEKTYSKSLLTLESKYAVTKSIKVGLLYRNSWQTNTFALIDGKKQLTAQRVAIGLQLEPSEWFKMDEFLGIQWTSRIQFESFKFKRDQWYWRNRLTLKPQLKSKIFKPFVSGELFYRPNQYYFLSGDEFVTEGLMNEIRYTLGAELELNSSNNFTFGIMLRDYRTSRNTDLVLNVSFMHSFGKKK
jgi:hypothetical protein